MTESLIIHQSIPHYPLVVELLIKDDHTEYT